MNIDLGSPALDIAISLSFIFFLLSLIASALTEAWAWFRNLRAKTLKKGLEGMLGDSGLVEGLFTHPLIRTEVQKQPAFGLCVPGRKGKERGPSYISPRNFASAFKASTAVNENVSLQLKALGVPSGVAADAPDETLEQWFEDAMDRVNGWYKRHALAVTIVIAAIVAIGLNASTLRIVEQLQKEPTVRATLVAQAEAAAENEKLSSNEGAESLEEAGNAASAAYSKIDGLRLPIFWARENVPKSASAIISTVVGIFLTTIAISLGAPFWFGALTKLTSLRAAGKKPEEGAKPKAAAAGTG